MGDLVSNISINIGILKDLKCFSILIAIILFIIIAVKMSRNIVYEVFDTIFYNKNAVLKINMELFEIIQIYLSIIVLFIFSGPPILGFVINAENISFKMYIVMSVIFGIIISGVFRVLASLNKDDVNSFVYCHAIFTVTGYVIYLYFWYYSGGKENYAKKIWNSVGEMVEDGFFQNLILMFLLIVVGTELIINFITSHNRINLSKTEYKR